MVGATGIEPVTPTMSTLESPVLYVHFIDFIEYKNIKTCTKMIAQKVNNACLH